MDNKQIMTQYSKDKAYEFLRTKMKQMDRVDKKERVCGDETQYLCITAKIVRCVFLYFNRRILLSHKVHIETFPKNVLNLLRERCIYNLKQVKKYQSKYNSRFTYQQTRYIHLTLNTLKKYYYLHHYKDIIIAITLRRKLDGQEGVCRLIQTYL